MRRTIRLGCHFGIVPLRVFVWGHGCATQHCLYFTVDGALAVTMRSFCTSLQNGLTWLAVLYSLRFDRAVLRFSERRLRRNFLVLCFFLRCATARVRKCLAYANGELEQACVVCAKFCKFRTENGWTLLLSPTELEAPLMSRTHTLAESRDR